MQTLIVLDEIEMAGAKPGISIPDNFVVAGGAVRRWFVGEPQSGDVDVFRVDGEDDYEIEIDGLKKLHSTIVAQNYKYGDRWVQVIKRPYNSIDGLLNSFDFHHCQFAYDGKEIFATKRAITTAMRKHLSLNNIIEGFELDTLRRAFKYCRQGYMPCSGTIGDLANAMRDSESDFDEQLHMSPGGGEKSIISLTKPLTKSPTMPKLIPLDQIPPEKISEQIEIRRLRAKSHYTSYLYGARNTWKDHKSRYDDLIGEIKALKQRAEII